VSQLCRKCRQPPGVIIRPLIGQRYVLAVDEAGFLEAIGECGDQIRVSES